VVAGVNDMSANRVSAQIALVEEAGASAVVATAPYYVMPNPSEVEQHFRLIARGTSLPVLAYDVPVRVHAKLNAATLVRLGKEGVIAGVKDSSGDDVAFRALVLANAEAGRPLRLFTGHETVVDGALLAGADGVVPGLANVDPAGYVRLYEAARDGRWDDARREQDRLARLFAIVHAAPQLVGEAAGLGAFKTALALLGVIAGNAMAVPVTRQQTDAAANIRGILDAELPVVG
jgi:4-hydroxy-tetrahydrodipicolinate synthase